MIAAISAANGANEVIILEKMDMLGKKLLITGKGRCNITNAIDSSFITIPNFSENERKYQELWTAFFKTIAIKERSNSRLQMQYMPKKYWQDLIEDVENI